MVWQRLPGDKSASISHIDEEAAHRVPETRRRVIVEASAASWNEILSVNLMGYVFCAKAAVPLMRRYSMPIVDATLVGRTRKLRRFANV